MKIILTVLVLVTVLQCQQLRKMGNSLGRKNGSECVKELLQLSRSDREDSIYKIIMAGNIPSFLQKFVPITTSAVINDKEYILEYFVTPDYISIGNDSDYFLCPMTPLLGQRIANEWDCILPTKKMVDQIYISADIKIPPQPIPPDSIMTMLSRFIQHNDSVQMLRKPLVRKFPLGSLVAGTKKDIIIHQKIYSELKPGRPKPVVIYGWHTMTGDPIQPPNNWHQETYVDYSHGVRLIRKMAKINSTDISIIDILQDEQYHVLVSDTVLTKPYYEIQKQ